MKVDIEIKNDGQPSRRFPMEVEAREQDRRDVFAFCLWFIYGFAGLTLLAVVVIACAKALKGAP